jgi:hypothetical protein
MYSVSLKIYKNTIEISPDGLVDQYSYSMYHSYEGFKHGVGYPENNGYRLAYYRLAFVRCNSVW